MAIEMFGPTIAPYASVACVISFLMTGHRSVYPSQVLQVSKSASIHVQIGGEIQDIEATYEPRESTLIGMARAIYQKLSKHFWRKN